VWLKKQGFQEGDLRSDRSGGFPATHPLGHACYKGELNVCKWLFDHGATADITKAERSGYTPMLLASWRCHLSVCKWLFEVGAAKDINTKSNHGNSPMHMACWEGHLSVCEWLFEMGAAKDVSKVDKHGVTPMLKACGKGHLPLCKWLFEVGAAADITKASNIGYTPMFVACQNGHLSMCKWLFEMGAAADIRKEIKDGRTPGRIALLRAPLFLCKWLVLNGAFKGRSFLDLESDFRNTGRRKLMREWAEDVIFQANAGSSCRRVFLVGALSAADPQRRRSSHLWMLNEQGASFSRMFKELIAAFVGGIETGERLRNARVLAEALC
jgi:hypothetical protein